MPYAPKFCFEEFGDAAPAHLEEEFSRITEGIYPPAVERMKREGYDPLIIGNSHDVPWDFPKVIAESFGGVLPERRLRIGAEMMPQQLEWLSDFLRCAKEYAANKTIRGEKPSDELVDDLRSYQRSLSGSHKGMLHCIDAGMEILPLEHPDFQAWVMQDRASPLVEESQWAESLEWNDLQPAYTSIRRERHSLDVLDRERPDVVIVGTYHALKYDLLLGRNGARCHLYSIEPLRWDQTLRMWREAHDLYRKNALQPA
ncbi:MAG: hypothetical protein QY323_03350 [Patescibacteria group bacterium]|nr:MAG: hypothetical protein QY323_03350 [Patescibacteria group bacterium]